MLGRMYAMSPNPSRRGSRVLRRCLLVVLALYAVQLGIVGTSYFWPAIDVEDEQHRYVVSRFNGPASFLPGIGLLPEVIGEPVWLSLTHKRTGTTTRKQYDLIGDVKYDYPTVANASYVRRMFD